MKIYYSTRDRTPDLLNQRHTCYHLSQCGELLKKMITRQWGLLWRITCKTNQFSLQYFSKKNKSCSYFLNPPGTNQRTRNGWNVWINYCTSHIGPHTYRSSCWLLRNLAEILLPTLWIGRALFATVSTNSHDERLFWYTSVVQVWLHPLFTVVDSELI